MLKSPDFENDLERVESCIQCGEILLFSAVTHHSLTPNRFYIKIDSQSNYPEIPDSSKKDKINVDILIDYYDFSAILS